MLAAVPLAGLALRAAPVADPATLEISMPVVSRIRGRLVKGESAQSAPNAAACDALWFAGKPWD
jgi:hypothetical protein